MYAPKNASHLAGSVVRIEPRIAHKQGVGGSVTLHVGHLDGLLGPGPLTCGKRHKNLGVGHVCLRWQGL